MRVSIVEFIFQEPSFLLTKMSVMGNSFKREGVTSLTPTYQFNQLTGVLPGMEISLVFHNEFKCLSCFKKTKKMYSGFCYVCLIKKAAADNCVLNPYKCHFMQGTCREPKWGMSFCYQPHYVYLAYTDKFKVGITRESQIPTRWIDQGATAAAILCRVSSRHQSGVLEKSLTQFLSDKSHWSRMLKNLNERPSLNDFLDKWHEVQTLLKKEIETHSDTIFVPLPKELNLDPEIQVMDNPEVFFIDYPLPTFLQLDGIKSISLEKEKSLTATIQGIKGQYLLFGERAMNIRSHEGFIVEISLKNWPSPLHSSLLKS